MFSHGDTNSKNNFPKQPSFNIDSIFSLYENPQYVGQDKEVDHYRVFQKNSTIIQVDLFVNSNDHLMQKVQYVYSNNQFVSIVFEVFDINPEFPHGQFDERNYIVNVNGKLQASNNFRQFKVIDTNQGNKTAVK